MRLPSPWLLSAVLLLATACRSGEPGRWEGGSLQALSPSAYPGGPEAAFTGFEKLSAYIPMSDGARLAADVYLPALPVGSGPTPASSPTVLFLSPYERATLDPDTGELWDAADFAGSPDGLVAHGYALVIVDTRGTGASSGASLIFGHRYQKDAGEVIDWIAAQAWCDGNVGMIGGSHVGWTQLAAASFQSPALKAIIPRVVPFDAYTGQFRPGGILMQGFLKGVGVEGEESPAPLSAPVVDEDGDGELLDELPLDIDGDGDPISGYDPADPTRWPPRYADGEPREHIHVLALLDRHLADPAEVDFFLDAPFLDSAAPTGEDLRAACADLAAPIAESGVAICFLGGWFDGFTRGTFEWYATLAPTNPARVVLLPGYHALDDGFYYEQHGIERPDLVPLYRRFFDRYLRGIPNGIDEEPPVLLFNMNGDGWRAESEWPLERAELVSYHLAPGGDLVCEAPEREHRDAYVADYAHDRRYGANLGSRWLGLRAIAPDGPPDMTAADERSLVYTSAPLAADLEVTGHPVVTLNLSSSADHGDVHVYLEDVDPEGRPLLVTEGLLRAGWHELHDNDAIMTGAALDVRPELPWHGYRKADWSEAALAEGRELELVIDLLPTSWVFEQGHSLRLAIAASNWPDFELHPELCPTNDPDDPDNVVPTLQVRTGGARASRIALPIVSR